MNQARLRLTILYIWGSAWVLAIVLTSLGPYLRQDGAIGNEQILDIIFTISGIWLPAFSCLAGFWFPSDVRKSAMEININREQSVAALLITAGYLTLIVYLLWRAIYLLEYSTDFLEPQPGASLEEEVSASVKLALLLSPVALAPINWLTGGTCRGARNKTTKMPRPTNPPG